MGWKIKGGFDKDIRRSVLVIAPHTSNWDFVIGRLVFNVLRLNVRFLIKKEAFVFPLGSLLRHWGGIPVERHKKTNLVDQVAAHFKNSNELIIAITPEGTRSRVKHWKKGFYYIAKKADVPIVLGYLDYAKKEVGLGPVIKPGGDYQQDAHIMKTFYQNKTAKHPDQFNLTAITGSTKSNKS
ncbi:MAG: 1-acyl-sn-glycerol-3-phosphate acyltransferase [Bacteroidota bacterium]